ncbi:MAG: methylmalonyl-CoA epimerase [Rhodobacteraceae bacterium]|nr:methylmalonyl-CoA epimerase [Paracoccaceae bacterium]MYF44845.1 methylmalonyl-CoA epimerase [Paracoccaceae bacterium]MYI91857.1 methylmalonyl-CoA epimerase [Paracoccaceae bacterium]MYJ87496.1 methylmalonyl-CoA epimerase [Paracoccaceae bacterium]
MIGALNHIAIVVPDLEKATRLYKEVLGGKVSEPDAFPEHGVTVVFVELPNTKIEFLEPLGENSPIAAFLEKNPSGGIHHFCLEVDDVNASMKKVKDEGLRVLGPPKIGAHGKPVIFLHPKDCLGTLVEFEEG